MVNFYTLLRLLAAALLGFIIANRAFAQNNAWPKAEDWVGKKPSEIVHTPDNWHEPRGMNFYDFLNIGARPTALWVNDFNDLQAMETPFQLIGRDMVFMAYDCGDKICKKGAALVYNLDSGQTIICEQTRTREIDDRLEPADIEGMDEEDTYIYADHLTFFTGRKSRVIDPEEPYLEKTGNSLSCGGSETDALNYRKVLEQLLLAEKLLP